MIYYDFDRLRDNQWNHNNQCNPGSDSKNDNAGNIHCLDCLVYAVCQDFADFLDYFDNAVGATGIICITGTDAMPKTGRRWTFSGRGSAVKILQLFSGIFLTNFAFRRTVLSHPVGMWRSVEYTAKNFNAFRRNATSLSLVVAFLRNAKNEGGDLFSTERSSLRDVKQIILKSFNPTNPSSDKQHSAE